MNHSRNLKAWLRTIWAALYRVRKPLTLFVLVTLVGALIFWRSGQHATYLQSIFYVLNLITLQAGPADLPQRVDLQLASLGVMFGGIAALAGGAANFLDYIRDPKEQQVALASTYNNHVVVCGVGRVGFRVINELREMGDSIVAVNQHEGEEWLAAFKKSDIPVIIGDARRRETLIDAGVQRADAIIACTSDDLANLDIALDARELNPNIKVVLRMFDQKLGEKVSRGFGINTVFSVSALAAPALAAAAQRAKINYSFKVDGLLLNVVTIGFQPNARFIGKTIKQVEDELRCSFLGWSEPHTAMQMNPPHEHVLRAGVRYHVIGGLDAVRALNNGS
jgi:Trk K+ transport system NAD-binding subunit